MCVTVVFFCEFARKGSIFILYLQIYMCFSLQIVEKYMKTYNNPRIKKYSGIGVYRISILDLLFRRATILLLSAAFAVATFAAVHTALFKH